MTQWKRVQGSLNISQEQFDSTSSKICVYERRNFEIVENKQEDGSIVQLLEYDERTMSKEEYNQIQIKALNKDLKSSNEAIDDIIVSILGG